MCKYQIRDQFNVDSRVPYSCTW